MATLKDVAKDAGVSTATVSCCLNGTRYVKPETRMKIMDSVEKLKYIPNASARSLRSSVTNCIGVVLTDIDNTYHTEIFKGVSAFFQRRGFAINVAFSNNLPDIECEKIEEFISQNVSGLVIITCQPQNTEFFVNRIKNYNIPTVFIERRPEEITVNFVAFDNYKTIYSLTSALFEKGYTNIALITGNRNFSSEMDCINGLETACRDFCISTEKIKIYETDMSKEDAFKTTISQLDESVQAVIATSENIVYGVLEALHILGRDASKDFFLFTLSEETWNSYTKPQGVVCSSRIAYTLGREAARLLLENIKKPVFFEEKTILLQDHVSDPKDICKAVPVIQLDSAGTNKDKTLRILMTDLTTSRSAKALSKYFTRNTGIPVEIQFLRPNELLKTISRDIEHSENYFDIYMYDVPWLEYMAQNEYIADISDLVNGETFDKTQLFQANMDNCFYNEAYYGIPIIGGAQVMFYRQDLFENREVAKLFKQKYQISLRPPKTWTEFNGTAEFFTRKYNPESPIEYGTSMAGSMDEELAPEILIRLWACGGNVWDKSYRVCLDTPENEKAFQSILNTMKYVEKDPFKTTIESTVSDFVSGKTAMLITYTEYVDRISKHVRTNTLGRVGYSTIPGKTPLSIGWNLGMNPYTSKKEEVYQYFRWLCKKEISYYMTILDGQSTMIAPYHNHELLKLYPWLEITEESFNYCRKRNGPSRKKSLVLPQSKIEAVLCSVLKNIVVGGMTVRDALATGQKEMEMLFKAYGYPRPLHLIK